MTCCHGDIYITPRDMAKFGYLYLKKGMWNGTRIISEEWIYKSLQNHITPPVNWTYGEANNSGMNMTIVAANDPQNLEDPFKQELSIIMAYPS